VVGTTLRLDGKPTTIIGVMPEGMLFPSNTELWTQLDLGKDAADRKSRGLAVFGRLKSGTSRTQAQAEMNSIQARLATAYPHTNTEFTGVRVETFNERFNGGRIRTVMLPMIGAGGVRLLLPCADVGDPP